MIEVKLKLYTPWELAIIHEGMSIIHKARESQRTTAVSAEPPVKTYTHVVPEDETPEDHSEGGCPCNPRVDEAAGVVHHNPIPRGVDESVIATITPAGVTKPERNMANITTPEIEAALTELAPMKYDAVEAAMHAALKAHGTPKTREILESYVTDGKRVKDLDPAVWPEIVARLEAGK